MYGQNRCDTCSHANFHEDRHGFDFGPAEVSFECGVFDATGPQVEYEVSLLTFRQRDSLDAQELGVSVDCPAWSSKSDDREHFAFLFGDEL